jgi:DNA mismatch repair protein MutS
MEVGSFWELYDCNDNKGADMPYVCSLLNIVCSKKNKNISEVSAQNPRMAGFPNHALGKFLPILIDDNFTVVLVSQTTPPPNPQRGVTDIISKATYIPELASVYHSKESSNTLMSIYIDKSLHPKLRTNVISCGIANIDISTGNVIISEISNIAKDENHCAHELYSIIKRFDPAEIIVYLKHPDETTSKEFLSESGLHDRKGVHHVGSYYDHDIHNIEYQCFMLSKAFNLQTSSHFIHDDLGIEKSPFISIALTLCLRYALEHNPLLIEKLQIPQYQKTDNNLNLSYNCYDQLDIPSISKILNKCQTNVGKRKFKLQLACPSTDPVKINQSYNIIDTMKTLSPDVLIRVREILPSIIDLEKTMRRAVTLKLHPHEICGVLDSITSIVSLSQIVPDEIFKHLLIDKSSINQAYLEIKNKIQGALDVGKCINSTLDSMNIDIFNKDYHTRLGEYVQDLKSSLSYWEETVSKWNQITGNSFFKLERNEKEGYFVSVTSKRYNDTKDNISKNCLIFKKFFKVGEGANARLTSDDLKSFNLQFEHKEKVIGDLQKTLWKEFLKTFFVDCISHVMKTVNFIELIDYYSTLTLISTRYNYCRPSIIDNQDNTSMVYCQQVRHPLVEILRDDVPYIANDISISAEHNGLLLFGLNSAGKSTLMKSIAISVIMAQAGMFVPCTSMKLSPFQDIFTRITKGDDILNGKSTFVLEMSELKNILVRATNRSLVIGDELCSGTETVSATAIVASGIDHLVKTGAKFVFATHLHELLGIKQVKDCQNIQVKHLHVACQEDGKLVYYRQLRDGPGESLYGIEVCRSLGIPQSLIKQALMIRDSMMNGNTLIPKRSSYNTKLLLTNNCEICKNQISGKKEVHHIEEQAKLHVNSFKKNKRENLVILCETCHDLVHNGFIKINGKIETSQQLILDVHQVEVTKNKSNDSDDSESKQSIDKVIQNYRADGLTYQKIILKVWENHQIKISLYQVRKILSQEI